MTISVISTPQLTPLFDDIYVAGSFNAWNPADENFKLTETGNVWSIDISGTDGEVIEFKFTRGIDGWNTVEGDPLGVYITNRTATFQNGGTLELTIEGWEDIAGNHTVTENVFIVDSDFPLPQLERTRRIWIYLPDDYFDSNNDYEVLYMHDGQNVFDAATSFSGEWEVDETMTETLQGCATNAIIVGIDNGGVNRIDEYSPWVNVEYSEGGEGIQFAMWMVETLKPFIDENFRTKPEREFTATAGSSLGALIAMYLITEHNDVFSKAGIFSPAFWFNEEIFDFVENNPPANDSKIYFVCGDEESTGMVPDMQQMYNIANNAGFGDLQYVVVPGGQHNEYYWSLYFPDSFPFLFDCLLSVEEGNSHPLIYSFPNPTSDSINIATRSGAIIRSLQVITDDGRLVKEVLDVNSERVNVSLSGMSFGYYIIKAICDNGALDQELRIECGYVPVIKN
ncbi:MAG: alpha/beta hydrolase-fold protein [Flavobacteriales bacterium]|nr:alpha/beta hydrolase-fold protein [Flavobacteriales bacterium]